MSWYQIIGVLWFVGIIVLLVLLRAIPCDHRFIVDGRCADCDMPIAPDKVEP